MTLVGTPFQLTNLLKLLMKSDELLDGTRSNNNARLDTHVCNVTHILFIVELSELNIDFTNKGPKFSTLAQLCKMNNYRTYVTLLMVVSLDIDSF